MKMIEYQSLDEEELEMWWQSFTRVEIFDRLEMTHTCFSSIYPEVRGIPEDERLQILEEEEELCWQLENFLTDRGDMKKSFIGRADDFNMMFFDYLDQMLETLQPWFQWGSCMWAVNNHDILSPGEIIDWNHCNSRGEKTRKDTGKVFKRAKCLPFFLGRFTYIFT